MNSALESLAHHTAFQSDKGSWNSLCPISSASALPHNLLLRSAISTLFLLTDLLQQQHGLAREAALRCTGYAPSPVASLLRPSQQ